MRSGIIVFIVALCAVVVSAADCLCCAYSPDKTCADCKQWHTDAYCCANATQCQGCSGMWCIPPPPTPMPPTPPPTPNPFVGAPFYVNPSYQKELDSSIKTANGTVKTTLQAMRNVASAYWIDVKAKIRGDNTTTVEGILQDASKKSPAELVVFIVYDLPNRDCHAKASNGEICCTYNEDRTCDYNKGGDCSEGLKEYQSTYIDPLVTVFKKYSKLVPIRLVIEPDSLPNLATNMADPHCGNSATVAAYTIGIPYAINAIAAACPDIPMYLDAAHGGWIGWEDNLDKFVVQVQKLNIMKALRGFSTNVANYQPLGIQCPWEGETPTSDRNDFCLNSHHQDHPCCADPCRLEGQYNPANNEHNFVAVLNHAVQKAMPGSIPHFIIDTGRNGVADMRSDCANWCNIRGAGIGLIPTTKTANRTIDAYYWLKTPGESDGCTEVLPDGNKCARYDSFCGHQDCIGSKQGEPRVPEAGHWFDWQIKMLAANAHMHPNTTSFRY